MSNRKPAPLTLTSLALAMILCSGCLGSNEPQKSSRDMNSEERVETETAKEQPKKQSPPVTRKAPRKIENALAIEPHELDGVEVALLRVKRSSDKTLTVYWSYINRSDEDKLIMKNAWRDSRSVLVSSAYLIDSVNQKKLPVVRARSHNDPPVASKSSENSVILKPGTTYRVWAKFPAPPLDVDRVSIYIPRIPPIEDIQIGT